MENQKKIRKYTLINAIEHNGKAQAKSVIGKILADIPELRKDMLKIRSEIEIEVERVNKLSKDKIKKELDELGGIIKQKRVEKKELSELDVGRDGIVVRFAPNPDGAIHMGNARPAILCHEYLKKYKGKYILRYDDTDPKIKKPEKQYYKWIKEDLKWLGIVPDKTIIQSKRLKIYFKYAEILVSKGNAYVCECGEKWKKFRDKRRPCPCRSINKKEQMKRWKNMLSWKYKEGEAVLRVKTDIDARNPAIVDWPAVRIVDSPSHPLVKSHIWPLFNFASGIDDHLMGITHIFRGQEHSTNEDKQRYMYEYFKWQYPEVVTLGRLSMSDMTLSKSFIREGIEKREYSGWDDLKLGTIRSLNRRGFHPNTIRRIIFEIGPKPNDITISTENLSAYNRMEIDKTSDRYYFVSDPKLITVPGLKLKSVKLKLHPSSKNTRTVKITDKFYINKQDFIKNKGIEVRLKGLCNIKLEEKSKITGYDVKPTPKIQWVPQNKISMKIYKPDSELNGYAEVTIAKLNLRI